MVTRGNPAGGPKHKPQWAKDADRRDAERRAAERAVGAAPAMTEERRIILALFDPMTDHADGCLFKTDRLACQCGFSEVVGRYRWAIRRAREIAVAHHGAAARVNGPTFDDEPPCACFRAEAIKA